MFKSISELKEFIIWAKGQRVQQLKLEGVDVTFSPLAYVDDVVERSQIPAQPNALLTLQERLEEQVEQDELLFHSSLP